MDTHGIKEKETVMYKVRRLTAKQQEDFDDLIKRYGDIFVKDKNKLGRTNVTKHNIDTEMKNQLNKDHIGCHKKKKRLTRKNYKRC